jgi:hypothetical protein
MVSTILLQLAQRTKFEKASLLVWFAYDDVRWSCHCPSLQLESTGDSMATVHRQMILQIDQFAQKCHLHGNLKSRLNTLGWTIMNESCSFEVDRQSPADHLSAEKILVEFIHFEPKYLFNVNE